VEVTPYLETQMARFRARINWRNGNDEDCETNFKRAAGLLRELTMPFWLGVTLLEHGEWLSQHNRVDDARSLLDEAQEIFEQLRARPWLERLEKTLPEREVAPA
jgi:hypothetical protein